MPCEVHQHDENEDCVVPVQGVSGRINTVAARVGTYMYVDFGWAKSKPMKREAA